MTDAVRVAQKFKVHGVFENVSSEPIEAKVFKGINPAMG
jgi:hypothetical protein